MNYTHTEQRLVEGYLSKQKRRIKNGQITSWRYFKFSLIDKERCFVMKSKQEDNSVLKAYTAKQIKGFTDKLSKEENIFGSNNAFAFKIITTIKSYLVCASNKEEFQAWMKVLQKFSDTNLKKTMSSSNSNKNQIEFQGLQIAQSNNINNIIKLNDSKKQENSYGKKKYNKNWDDEEKDSDEEKDVFDSQIETRARKNSGGNFGSMGNFGTFGNQNNGFISNINENNSGSVKYEDKAKYFDNRLKKLNEIPMESNFKLSSENVNGNVSNVFPSKQTITYSSKKDIQLERVQIPFESLKINSSNSSMNNSNRMEDRINRPKDVGVTNNTSNNNVNGNINNNNNNNNKYQPNFGKLEITGEMKKSSLNKNLYFEGLPRKEEKGIVPPMESVKPLTGLNNQPNPNFLYETESINMKQSGGIIASNSKTPKTKNFIVEFSNQDCFELNPFVIPNKKEEDKKEFETLKNKMTVPTNSNEQKLKSSSNENLVNMSRQSQHNEKFQFMPDEGVKSSVYTPDNYIKSNRSNLRSNTLNQAQGKSNFEEPTPIPKNINMPLPKQNEELNTEFPKIKTKSDLKKETNIIQRNNQNKIENKPVTIFDENLMHIKQGIDSGKNIKIALENLNFCPIVNYENKSNQIEEKKPQGAPAKRILPTRKPQEPKEELKLEIPTGNNPDLLQLQKINDDKPRENNFTGKQNMKKRILGSSQIDPTINLDKKNNKSITTQNVLQKNLINNEIANIDYIQSNKKTVRVPVEKFAMKKDLNHMNVENTYQRDSHTVLADEFHMPMDKVVHFQHKQINVYDYNDHTKNNMYLSNIHADSSSIVGGFGDMDSDKIIIDEIDKIGQMHSNNLSYSLLDVEEDWDGKKTKDNNDLRFD